MAQKPRPLQPHLSARHLFGAQLRQYRVEQGLSQQALGRLVHVSGDLIGKIEKGERSASADLARRCDAKLDTDGRLLQIWHTIGRESGPSPTHSVERPGVPPYLPASPRPPTIDGEDVKAPSVVPHTQVTSESCPQGQTTSPGHGAGRACGLRCVAGKPPIDANSTPADEAAIVTIVVEGQRHQLRLNRRALLEAVSGALMTPLFDGGAAPRSEDVRIDPRIVEHFAALRAVLVESDNRLGAAAVLPTVRQQLDHIAQSRRAARGGLHAELLRTEARWAEFAGWLSDDLGDRTAGDWWLGQALTMAQEVDDAEFTTYVFARMAQRATDATDRDRVLGLAHAAARRGCERVQVRAFAALQRAHGYSIMGDVTEFKSAVEDAHRLVSGAAATGGELGSFCTSPYVWAQEGDGWLRLGRPHIAVERFRMALAAWPEPYRRDRGLYLARTAAAHVSAGDPEQAAATAMTALELADVTQSARIRREVASVGRRLEKFRTEPGVDELLAALAPAA